MTISQAVILVGGKGTRLEPITSSLPKPLVNISNKPFLLHIIDQLSAHNFKEVILLTGYKSGIFKKIFSKYSSKNIKIKIIEQPVDFETGARIISEIKNLKKNFLLLYGDNYCGLNLKKMINNFKVKNGLFQILAYYDWNKFSRPNLYIDENNKIKLFDYNRSKKNLNYVDIGYICVNKKSIENIKFHTGLSLSRHIIPKLIKKGVVTAYKTYNLYCTVGTMDRLMRAKIMLSDRKFIFLDRDGVLNQKPKKGSYVSKLSEIIWNKGSLNALKVLKKKKYETIIVTNQAGIGRGILKNEIVKSIHSKMSDDVRSYGGSIDYIYVCPHHWINNCFCRKPSPGLFLKAQYDLNLDFTKIYFIGDQETDKEVAQMLDIKYLNLNKKKKLNNLIKKII